MSVPLNGPMPGWGRVDFGWLGQAWALFMARPGVWIAATFLLFLVSVALWLLWALPTGTLATLRQMYVAITTSSPALMPKGSPVKDFALDRVLAVLAGGLEAVLLGGLYRTALRQMRGEPVSALGLFSGLSSAPVLLAVGLVPAAALGVIEGLVLWVLHLAHLSSATSGSLIGQIAVLPGLVLDGLLMFAPLLVVDQGVGAADALLGSVRLLRGQWLHGVFFYLVAAVIGSLGALVCGVGMLASYPLFFLSITVGYVSLTQPAADPPFGSDLAPTPGVWPPPPQVQ